MPSYTNENEKKDKINKTKRIEAFPSHIPPFMVSFISVITALNAHLSVSYRSINATRLVDDFHSMARAQPPLANTRCLLRNGALFCHRIPGNVVVDVDVVTGGEDQVCPSIHDPLE